MVYYYKKPKITKVKTYISYLAESIHKGTITYDDAIMAMSRPGKFGSPVVPKEKIKELKNILKILNSK